MTDSHEDDDDLDAPEEGPEKESTKKDNEKKIQEDLALQRKAMLEAKGLDEKEQGRLARLKNLSKRYNESDFGKAAKNLGDSMMKPSKMDEADLLEAALYNLLLMLLALLMGGIGAGKSLYNRKHLDSDNQRKEAKKEHKEGLEDADLLKKEIGELKEDEKELEEKEEELKGEIKKLENDEDNSVANLPKYTKLNEELTEVQDKLKSTREEIKDKEGKYDDAVLKMAKAEKKFEKHGDASKTQEWKDTMTTYLEVRGKLDKAKEDYDKAKAEVDALPLKNFIERGQKRKEVKLEEKENAYRALEQQEIDLYRKIEKLEKGIGKDSAELQQMRNERKDHNDKIDGPNGALEIAGKLETIEELDIKLKEAKEKEEDLVKKKEDLESEKVELAEKLKDPDGKLTPAEKLNLSEEIKKKDAELVRLNGDPELKAALDQEKVQLEDDTKRINALSPGEKDSDANKKKLAENKNKLIEIEAKLDGPEVKGMIKVNQEEQASLTAKIDKENAEIDDMKKAAAANPSAPIAAFSVAAGDPNPHEAEPAPVLEVENDPEPAPSRVESISSPVPLTGAPESAPPPSSGDPVATTSSRLSVVSPAPAPAPAPEASSAPKPPKPEPLTVDWLVKKIAKLEHPVPEEGVMERFKFMMEQGAAVQQKQNLDNFLDKNNTFRPTESNVDDKTKREKYFQAMFMKAYADHLRKSPDQLNTNQLIQVVALARKVASDENTTSLLKAHVQAADKVSKMPEPEATTATTDKDLAGKKDEKTPSAAGDLIESDAVRKSKEEKEERDRSKRKKN
jgi:hypothetical protein